jgi:S-adenosylmethionine decarboxylase
MARVKPLKKLKLHSFNNLTKSLSFNLYDVSWAKTEEERAAYLHYIDEEYNAERLTALLKDVVQIIGANVLNIARQDYEPQGASVTVLISEEPVEQEAPQEQRDVAAAGEMYGNTVVGHLDKSHICVHTYPEYHPDNGICTFRADLEVSTCGRISPLHALDYLIREFDSDVINIDYRVRGFTRDVNGTKHFIDHRIHSIQDFIAKDLIENYQAVDVNMFQERLFHTKLMWKQVDLDRYCFGGKEANERLGSADRRKVKKRLTQEIQEIFEAGSLF